jgi:nitrogen fixation protein FixH
MTLSHHLLRRLAASTLAAALLVASGVAAPAQAQAGQAKKTGLDIAFSSKPNPPKSGDNSFEVVVKDATGKPVTDAEVSALFYMPPMPAMKMGEMKNTVPLKHVKDGRYAGSGMVMMSGKWDVTVTVKRAGKELDSKKFPITAQ